ncbi:retrovirus-related pol polyprotein from transposon TNT 1-94 [Tanacetum coccineum]
MALADDELAVRKTHARNDEWIDITVRKVNILDEDADWQTYLKYINIDLKFVEEQRLNLFSKYNKIVFELNKCRDDLLVFKQAKLDAVTFQIQNTKLTMLNHALQEQLKEERKGASSSFEVMPLTYQDHSPRERHGSGTMKHTKPKTQEFLSKSVSGSVTVCNTEPVTSLVPTKVKNNDQESKINELTKLILKAKAKPYPPCTHYGFNDHHLDDCRNYPECEICGSYDHFTLRHNRVILVSEGVLVESRQSNESSISVSCTTYRSNVHSSTDYNDFEPFKKGISQNFSSPYTQEQNGIDKRKNRTLIEAVRTMLNGSVFSKHFLTKAVMISLIIEYLVKISKKARILELKQRNMKITVLTSNTPYPYAVSIRLIHQGRYGVFVSALHQRPQRIKDQYANSSYLGLKKKYRLSLKNDMPPRDKLPDLIHTEGTQDQEVQNEQINSQPTEYPSGNNIEPLVSITELSVHEVTQSQITHYASTSSYPAPQDRWSRDQHIKLLNIIGQPTEGMLTRSMTAKLIAASVSECLFADFLFKIELKKVYEALKHLGWVDAIQEEGIEYDETFAPMARMEAIKVFLAFSTYMNFKVFQMDVKSAFLNGKLREEVYVKQPPGFESSEFPDYVWELDKAFYGLK